MFYTHIEAAARGQTSANQEERLSQETNLILDLLQNCEEMNFCCVSHPVCNAFIVASQAESKDFPSSVLKTERVA